MLLMHWANNKADDVSAVFWKFNFTSPGGRIENLAGRVILGQRKWTREL